MSLKSFHVIFIALAVAMAFGFAFWLSSIESGNAFFYSVLATTFGVSLIIYEFRFLKKLKHISFY
ncbi:MAG: hypothetical protein FJ218_10000 [Ignavibacteria bacterium]|nr:hypothetical protein [Ignavibacteria bacterium]